MFAMAVAGSAAAALVIAEGALSGGQPPAFRGGLDVFKPQAQARAAPEIAFTDAAGHSLSLADFRGKTVLLNFWATWCAPCVKEMPSLDRLQQRLGGDRFAVVAISVDREGLSVVRPFLAQTQIQGLATYVDPKGASMRAFGVRGLPTTFVIDRSGKEAGHIEGQAAWDTPEAEALIRYYLRAAAPQMDRAEAAH
ncbi:MAG: TlpA family protein disulfide reductase [Alphaproteobacteria bacterium]|nr:TlpA family protein disulfide reductase [Alphaproteobacteria bacterium]